MRTLLFVPASRPDRFQKALEAGADGVIIDLEDAVEPERKDVARRNVQDFAERSHASFMVRVNGATTSWFEPDLALCASLPGVSTVLLPKAESSDQIAQVAKSGKNVLPIVETARGVLQLQQLCASAGVLCVSFGSLDLMLELGVIPDTDAAKQLLQHVRCQILLHSAANGLAKPLDGVYPDFSDAAGLQEHACHIRQMGFAGMLCIHPKQISPIHTAFAPTAQEQQWARRVIEIAEATGSSAFQLDGQMVDAPVIQRARELLGLQA